MKRPKNNRMILIFILTLSALCLFSGTVLADCDCIAANGLKYPDNTVGTVPCYQCPETGTCVQIGTLVCTGNPEPTPVPQTVSQPAAQSAAQVSSSVQTPKLTAGTQSAAVPTAVSVEIETASESKSVELKAVEPETAVTAEPEAEDPTEEPEIIETAESKAAEPETTETAEPEAEDPTEEPETTETAEPEAEDPTEEPETTETAEPEAEDPTEEPETTETAESEAEDPTEEPETTETAEPEAEDPTEEPETTETAEPEAEESTEEPDTTGTAEPEAEDPTEEPDTTETAEPEAEDPTEEPETTETAEPELTETPEDVSSLLGDGTETPTPTETATPQPLPDAPVPECPKGRYLTRGLGFYWAPSNNADSYTVNWSNDRGQNGSVNLSASDSTCQANRCVAYAVLPGVGNYTWTVTAVNTSGKASSKNMKFEIASNISTPTQYKPNGSIVNRNYPSFQWEDVEDGAVEYRIQIVRKYDGRLWLDNWYSVDNMYVGNGVCEVQTDIFLPAGTYSWRVQARNNDFPSGWSSWMDFYVECDYCTSDGAYYGTYSNLVPSPVYPAGTTITTLEPDFQWRPMTGVSYYLVKLYDAKGTALLSDQVSSASCTTELCTYDPQLELPDNGTYSWTVEAYGGNGGLWGTASSSFKAEAVIKLTEISFISPEQNGYLNAEMPLVIWTDPGENATIFHILIQDNTGEELFTADLNREAAWCDGQTCSIQFGSIPDGEDYKITITPYSDQLVQGSIAELVFSKGAKPFELISPKDNAVVSGRPMFRWTLGDITEYLPETVDASALTDFSYEISLKDADNQVTAITVPSCGGEGMTCEDDEAFFVPAENIPAGEYTLRLGIKDIETNGTEIHITVQ